MAGNGDGPAEYKRLADLLRSRIASGELAPGTRLPSERDLAEATSVSRTTVVAACNLLRADALVQTRRGLGTLGRRAASSTVVVADPFGRVYALTADGGLK
jgi:DNA-binding GntR family transcriptional regulator